jgi:hypothetical protein
MMSMLLPFYVVLAVILFLTVCRLFRFPMSLDDLVAIVRETNDDDMTDLMDPGREAELKASMSAQEFRQEQRMRMIHVFEYLRRRLFNGSMMLNFAYTARRKWKNTGEWESHAQGALIKEIIDAGVQFRIYALFATAKLGLWILLRVDRWSIFPAPSLADFREVVQIDGIHAYYRLTTAVGYLSMFYGERTYDRLMLKLRGHIPTV